MGDITLVVDLDDGSDTPTPTRPSRVVTGDHSAEPYLTVEAARAALPELIQHTVRIQLLAGEHGELELSGMVGNGDNGKIIVEPATGVDFVDYTPDTGLATGVIASGSLNQVTVTGAGWTPGELAGRAVAFDSNTHLILTNTADTLDLYKTDFTTITPSTPFTLKDFAVSLSVFSVTEVQGRVEVSSLKVEDGIRAEHASNISAVTCSLGFVSLVDCGNIELSFVAILELLVRRVRELSGSAPVGVNAQSSCSFESCDDLSFSELVVVNGGMEVSTCASFYTGGIVVRASSGNGVEIDQSSAYLGGTPFYIQSAGGIGIQVVDNCFIDFHGLLEGVAGGTLGLYVKGVNSQVNLSLTVPTLTGDDGDAGFKNMAPIAWTDLIDTVDSIPQTTEDAATGSRIYAGSR